MKYVFSREKRSMKKMWESEQKRLSVLPSGVPSLCLLLYAEGIQRKRGLDRRKEIWHYS